VFLHFKLKGEEDIHLSYILQIYHYFKHNTGLKYNDTLSGVQIMVGEIAADGAQTYVEIKVRKRGFWGLYVHKKVGKSSSWNLYVKITVGNSSSWGLYVKIKV